LSLVSPALGIAGYVFTIAITALGYALFQPANNAAVMASIADNNRGVVAGLLNLSRNLGFFTGASVLGAVFATQLPTNGIAAASPEDVTNGLHLTFAVALSLTGLAWLIAAGLRVPERLRQNKDNAGQR
jgi:hypothetical protein